ncbi:MAG: DNA-directed RNA polymerase subunit omega [Clostridia bacterium]|jgi:DNA-directed RNA polymerase omega subunit|nr:DNA-directed RNA polymerase subunit omega [Clostridia bacterium]MBQ3562804.1 DNA-directed RNA polymerase subunit omega [Clostridia bacterium]MBQ9920402.1 DNA-directed RNA polymerase subunit omega [Clostridia bacterium]
MLNPAIGKLINNSESRYQLVLEVAKQARVIAEKNENETDKALEKSVSLAIDKIAEEKGL